MSDLLGGNGLGQSIKKIPPSLFPKIIVGFLLFIIIGLFVVWGLDKLNVGKAHIYPVPVLGWGTLIEDEGETWKADNAAKEMKIPDKFDSCISEPGKGVTAFKGGSGADIDNLGAECWDKKEIKAVGNQGGNAYKIENPDGFDKIVVRTDDAKRFARGLEFYSGEKLIGKTGSGDAPNTTSIECLPDDIISGIKIAASKENGNDFRVGYIQVECSGARISNNGESYFK